MKLLIFALTLVPAAALSTSSGEFLAEFGDKHDAGAVMQKLTGMMGAAQQKLGLAERHHKKVVKKVRKEAETLLDAESKVYGNYLSGYSVELAQATQILQDAVTAAKAGLKIADAAPSNPNDWKDPSVEQRAKLGAQVASAERTIKKSQRRSARAVREAEEHGEETLEDEAQKLGLKVGDMTPLVDQAKKTLEATAEKAPVVAAGKKTADTASKKVDLKALTANLAVANKKNTDAAKDANKRLDGFLSKTDKEVATKTAKIQQDLEAEQKAEIEKVLGRKATPAAVKAPAAKKVVKKVEKAAAVKKVEKVEVKAAPAPKAKVAAKVVPAKAAEVKAAPAKAAEVKVAPVKAAAKPMKK